MVTLPISNMGVHLYTISQRQSEKDVLLEGS